MDIFSPTLPEAKDVSIEEMVYNVAGTKGQEVIWCESKNDPRAVNPNSSAKGLAQFLSGTWEANCRGNVFDPRANAVCFGRLFKTNPSYWEECL